MSILNKFNLEGKVCIVTGGAGLLGPSFAEAILDAGGTVILFDIDSEKLNAVVEGLRTTYNENVVGMEVDITDKDALESAHVEILKKHTRIDVLINNAANNPQADDKKNLTRLESFPEDMWDKDLAVGLKGAYLCSKIFGTHMASHNSGVILNIASDLGVVAPDQRLYKKENTPEDEQPVKPVTYSVVKHGIVGLTKYLATYWADKGVRVNTLSPGGVYTNQPDEFVQKVNDRIPMGRMARPQEYNATVLYLISDASSYMTGSNVVVDGGRTVW